MNDHLTHQEFTDYLLGARSATVEAHLAECPACGKELYQFRESVEAFRGAAQNWSEAPRASTLPLPRSFDWLLVGAVAMILATFAVFFFGDRAGTKQTVSHLASTSVVAENSAAQIQQDNELLSNINQEIFEGLPAPMQPLQVSVSHQAAENSSSRQ